MPETTRRPIVLVAIDYSETSARALSAALDLADAHAAHELHVVHVLENRPSQGPEGAPLEPEDERLGLFVLEHLGENNAAPPIERVVTHVLRGSPADAIAVLAGELGATTLVAGTHGRTGAKRLLLGSVAERLVRIAPCPTLVIPPAERREAAGVPQIEPPCPRCLEARRASEGRELWCEQHSHRHGRRHTVREVDRNDQAHAANSLLISSWGYGH